MLKIQWNALRRGDMVFVHDASDANLDLHALAAGPELRRVR